MTRLSPQDLDSIENDYLDATENFHNVGTTPARSLSGTKFVIPKEHDPATAKTITVRPGKRNGPSSNQLVGM